MIITKTINADLWIRERPQEIYAVQGDSATRKIAVKLYANREPWIPKEGVSLAIRYRKPDGTSGTYDTMPGGEKAWSLTENTVSFLLAPQMLTVPGRVETQVELYLGKSVLASFSLHILVEENVAACATVSRDYFNWTERLEHKLEETLLKAKESGLFDGETPDLQIGTVTTLEAGSEAAATITGTVMRPLLNLSIPKGADARVDTTLTVAGQAADAAVAGAALAGKAPAGYGLGETTCRYVNSINDITENGYYALWLDPANGDPVLGNFVFFAIVNVNYSNVNIQGNAGGGLLRRDKWDGVWQPWEWEDPPMANAVEYRTTKRWGGKPVYTQLLEAGSLPGSGSTHLNIPTSGTIDYILSAKGSVTAQRVFPTGKIAGVMSIDLETNIGGVDVYVSHDWLGGARFYVTVEYTLV